MLDVQRQGLAGAAVVVAAMLATATASAQDDDTFEVASIRRNASPNQQGSGLAAPQPGGRFTAVGVTLKRLIGDAYAGADVVGGPSWIDIDRFDISARAKGDQPPDAIRRMLQSLLAERFGLVVHVETREVPVYALAMARTDGRLGPALHESDAKCAQQARSYLPQVAPGDVPPCGDFRLGARALIARGMTMAGLARLLSGRVDRPVLDRTGLEAAYDLELEWSSDLGLRLAPPGSAGADDLRPDGVSLFTAMQEQLGLRLQSTRGHVDVIVVDRAEPPAPN